MEVITSHRRRRPRGSEGPLAGMELSVRGRRRLLPRANISSDSCTSNFQCHRQEEETTKIKIVNKEGDQFGLRSKQVQTEQRTTTLGLSTTWTTTIRYDRSMVATIQMQKMLAGRRVMGKKRRAKTTRSQRARAQLNLLVAGRITHLGLAAVVCPWQLAGRI